MEEDRHRDKRRIAALMRKVATLEHQLEKIAPKRVKSKRKRKVRRPSSAVPKASESPTMKTRPKSAGASSRRKAWDDRFNAPSRGPGLARAASFSRKCVATRAASRRGRPPARGAAQTRF